MTDRLELIGQIQRPGAKPENVRFFTQNPEPLIQPFTDQDATPSVLGYNLFQTANTIATTITDFDDGRVGQVIDIIVNDANTTFDFTASGLKGNSGVDYVASSGDAVRAVYDGTDWHCWISQS